MSDEPWYVYLLECADGSWYCGIAKNLQRRIAQHNGEMAGGAKYTCQRRPVSLLAYVGSPSRSEALKLEYRIKHLPRQEKLTTLRKLDLAHAQS